jgi:hypothetical protein
MLECSEPNAGGAANGGGAEGRLKWPRSFTTNRLHGMGTQKGMIY